MKLSRQRKLISRACLMAAASLIAAVPTARAANVFFDPNGATTAAATAAGIGTGGTANWDATLNYWVNAGAGTTIRPRRGLHVHQRRYGLFHRPKRHGDLAARRHAERHL
jgi:hypothetical protein